MWRRSALSLLALSVAASLAAQQPSRGPTAEDSALSARLKASAGDSLGRLVAPEAAGRSANVVTARDNSALIKDLEHKIRCTCGCNLDVFTCRTTDFSCTYSPELHREVVALYQDGKTAQQIIDAFVAKYGEKVLMAPEPVGFNLWGYLLPGVAITLGAAILAVVIGRRERVRSVALAAAPGSEGGGGAPPVAATPEELERLRAALAEVDD